ncbi:MAG: winged helix-turn-helix transcriptional regulator [Polyangiales bacterium]
MWILVVGSAALLERPDGAVTALRDLGCTVRTADLWDSLHAPELSEPPPAAIVVEAIDEIDAGRAALVRLRAVEHLRAVPALVAVSVGAVQRLSSREAFDDFILVPYVPVELYTRVRRSEWRHSEFSGEDRIKIGTLCLDLAAHEVEASGRHVKLTQQEFALLRFLAQNRGRVYTREQLLERVWGVDYYGGSRTVDIHVRRLRMKLEHDIDSLETVRGVGYKMRAP